MTGRDIIIDTPEHRFSWKIERHETPKRATRGPNKGEWVRVVCWIVYRDGVSLGPSPSRKAALSSVRTCETIYREHEAKA